MQRRVKQTDRYWIAPHCFENFDKVVLLDRQNLRQGSTTGFFILSDNHLAEGEDTVSFKEHMLSTTKANTFGAEFDCFFSVTDGVGICADLERTNLIGPAHDGGKVAGKFSFNGSNLPFVDNTAGSVQRDKVTFIETLASLGCKEFAFFIDLNF